MVIELAAYLSRAWGARDKRVRLSAWFNLAGSMDETNLLWLAGGTVDGSRLMLRFFGDDLDPDFVSQSLGLPPTESCRKGDLHRKGRFGEKTGRWVLEKERTAEPVENCLTHLLGSLTSDLAVWKELTQHFHGDLRCHLIAKRWNRGQSLGPQVLAAIADRGLELIIDVYFEPEEEG